ncbi:4'-phosphopantetheinyl transferase family protein [Microvirga alba]|uniref:4'-phosphopantetheinyl transferase superfamily protein n=1 Tax=Microvirga alba TaxID=2791025 RepID=A0A931FPW3_9HYPH|nr:4'-phosphopantetheinyl transferase superfamily protein [Microvirga alba]MBF9232853.1 4'-phosphopantetheinyl transferase superfamily protein [Microvirga alba]
MISLYAIDRRRSADILLSGCLDVFERTAGGAERRHAARLRRESDRLAYRIGHGGLRLAMAEECGFPPEEIRLETTPAGKPFVPGGPFFNLSHAGDMTLVAVSRTFDVGLDIERLAAPSDGAGSLSAALADEDEGLLASLSEIREHAETILWSIKEAALKLTGEVMVDPRHLAVTRQWGGGFRVRPARAAKAPLPDIFVHLIVMHDDYVATLATYERAVTAQAAVVVKDLPLPSFCAFTAERVPKPAPQPIFRDSSLSARMWP